MGATGAWRGALLRGTPRWLDTAVGGWQLAAIYIFQSGQPLAWAGVIFIGNPEDIAAGPRPVDQRFNVNSAFTTASSTRPSYHYRTWPFYSSNPWRGAMNNIDLSINVRWRLSDEGTEVAGRSAEWI